LTPVAAAVLAMAVAVPGSALAGPSSGKTAGGQPWLRPGLSVDQRVSLLLSQMTLDEKIAELHADACSPYESCVPANPALGLPELVLEDDSTGVAAGMTGVTALPATIAASASWDPALITNYGAVIGREERKKGVDVALAPTVNIMRNPQWGRNFESLGEDPYLTSRMGVADMSGIQSQGIVADMKHFAVYNQEANRKTISAQVSSRALHEIYLPAWASAVKAGLGSVMASYNAINGVLNSQNPYLLTQVLRDELGFTGFVRSDGGGTYSTVPAAKAGLDIQVKGTDYFAAPLKAAVEDGQVSMATINSMVAPILRVMFEFHLVGKTWGEGTTTENVITPQDTQTALDTAEEGTVLLKNQGGLLPLSGSDLKSLAVIGPDASPGMSEGGGSGYVNPPFVVSPVQGIQAAARQAAVSYTPGLPDPGSLPSIPAQYLSSPYKAGNSYTATLTPPASGRYTLVVENTKGYQPMTLSLNGTPVLTAAGTTGDQYGSGSADLQAGQHYQLRISGPSVKLAWATPSARSATISQAVAAARQAQVAVVVVGDHESEAIDRVRIDLSGGQNQLVEAVAAANPHTIVVLNTGSPVVLPWASQVPAMLESWYPGEDDGTALANMLFGKVDPAGHLPDTFPASASQIPASTPAQFPGVNGVADYSEGIDVGYRWYEAHNVTPLFPFGYGLSYTTFSFSNLSVSPGSTTSLGTVRVAATVTNTGTRAGSEVAQLYVGDPASTGEPPRQLKGFQKASLAPGQSARVHFSLTSQDLSWYDSTVGTWVVSPGTYQLYVGDSSALADLPLRGTVQVPGSTGTRHVTVSAPGQAQAGHPVTVTATLTSGGNMALHGSRLALSAPAGWRVQPADQTTAGSLAPGQAMTASWQVTAPATAQDIIGQLTATATYQAPGHGGSGTSTARTQVTVTGPLLPPSLRRSPS
jgi:beta-glucosidase